MNKLRASRILYITLYVTIILAVINIQSALCTETEEKQAPLWANVDVEEFSLSRERLTLIDVREPEELRYHGCFSGAINIPRVCVCHIVCLSVCLYLSVHVLL